MVMGEIGGQEVDLCNPLTTYYLQRKGSTLTLSQTAPTSIGAVITTQPSFTICREGNSLFVSGQDLKSLRLYDVAGRLLQQTTSADGNHAVISLQGVGTGVCVLRIEAGKQCFSYRIR